MKLRRFNWMPLPVAGMVLLILGLLLGASLRFPALNFHQRLEWMTYDWRMRCAQAFACPCASNLAAVFIDDQTMEEIQNNPSLRIKASWPFPRHVQGRVVRELMAQGARVVGLDVIFDQRRDQDAPVPLTREQASELGLTDAQIAAAPTFPLRREVAGQPPSEVPGVLVESDDFFALVLRQSTNTVLAALPQLLPHPAFLGDGWWVGNVEGSKPDAEEKDHDGILRRFKAFDTCRVWHPTIRAYAATEGWALESAKIEGKTIVLGGAEHRGMGRIRIEPDQFMFQLESGEEHRVPVPPGTQPYQEKRLWQMGLVLAARQLGLDLDHADIDLARSRIVLPGPGGVSRTIPVDARGRFLIDWNLAWNDARLLTLSYSAIVSMDELRRNPRYPPEALGEYVAQLRQRTGKTNLAEASPFRDRLVVIGSTMTGNNLSDLGPTPISKQTYLVSAHWNVANSLLTGRFVRALSPLAEGLLMIGLGLAGLFITWQSRLISASVGILIAAALYVAASVWCYVQWRIWLPLVMPLLALLLVHAALESFWLVFARKEQRRVKAIFSRLVAPEVVEELLQEERLALGGTLRTVTVFFADVRGFTELTDISQGWAAEQVRQRRLSSQEADAFLDDQAREVLGTINLYLGAVAKVIKQHHGTLDKYIGDCVMAFWGAPSPDPHQAVSCVRAAIQAQRAIHVLNQERARANQRREEENARLREQGKSPQPLLPLLELGTGINTGAATVGLMGSDEHILNYTVFGREVNLASRLEHVSGRGRILISAATFAQVQREDAALAARCVQQPPIGVRGFQQPVETYEVDWSERGSDGVGP